MKLQKTRRHQLLSLSIALIFVLAMHVTKAEAQIDREIEATIPFEFHAGSAKLPPGKYSIEWLEDTDLTMMQIRSADRSVSALFEVRTTEEKSAPAQGELIFNKYGNDYFLAKLFDDYNRTGSEVVESRYEKRVSTAALATQEHVLAQHGGPKAN